jgi:hypothetical protein
MRQSHAISSALLLLFAGFCFVFGSDPPPEAARKAIPRPPIPNPESVGLLFKQTHEIVRQHRAVSDSLKSGQVLIQATSSEPASGRIEKTISPTGIYSTSSQQGINRLSRAPDTRYARQLDRLLNVPDGFGPSNSILIRASDLPEAIGITYTALRGYGDGTKVFQILPGKKSQLWFVGYLGASASSPPAWIIESLTIRGTTIQLKYSRPKSAIRTTDIFFYLVWVPLGRLETDSYRLELYDTTQNKVALSRQVAVTAD